jgi:hypothetical protein
MLACCEVSGCKADRRTLAELLSTTETQVKISAHMQFITKMGQNAKDSWDLQDSLETTPESLKRAFDLAQEGAALGCEHSKGALARCYYYGNGVYKNTTVAREIAEESAAAGSSYGQFVLGRCIQDGKGGDNDTEASRLYRLAADQGLAIAQHNLGVMLFFGLGVDENEDEAELLWYLAVLQGHNNSYRMLAYKYEKMQSYNPVVVGVFEAAAELGDANAQLQLGRMYEEGRGVFADTKKALKLYKSAMQQGLEGADAALVAALTCDDCCNKYDQFERKPLVLPCGCTFCEQCISKGPRGGRVSKCPRCGSRVCETAILQINEGVRGALGKGNAKIPPNQHARGLKRKQLRRAALMAASRPSNSW